MAAHTSSSNTITLPRFQALFSEYAVATGPGEGAGGSSRTISRPVQLHYAYPTSENASSTTFTCNTKSVPINRLDFISPKATSHLPDFAYIDAVSRRRITPQSIAESTPLPSVSQDDCTSGNWTRETVRNDESPRGSPPSDHREADAKGKRRICDVCGKEFDRPSSLKVHATSHTGDQPFVCPFPGCHKRFSVRSNMLRHNRLHLHSVDSGHPQKGLISSHRAPPFTTFIMDPRASSVSDPNDYDVQMSDSESRPEPRRSPSARSTMSPMGSPRRSSPPSSRPPVSFVLPESPAIHHPGKPPRMYLPTRS